MFNRGAKIAGALAAPVTALFLVGVAGAETPKVPEVKSTGPRLEEVQTRESAAAPSARERDLQIKNLASRAQPKEKASATHKAEKPVGITRVLHSIFGADNSNRKEDTVRSPDQKNKDYKKPQQERRARSGESRRRVSSRDSADRSSSKKKEQLETRLAQLRAAEQAGEFTRPPASDSGGGTPEIRDQELEIAQEEIVAQPVEPIPYEKYVQIYKESAKQYGFPKDWYVLAAIGKTESNHGENMGPSGAGALGPMQFLPSTWREYGVDGNEDGVANIMDPEDAIPAAAAYLKDGGAPEDWYAALYTYNHDGRYVRKVLGVAEGYRQLAKDGEVEPYI